MDESTSAAAVPEFGARRLLLFGTGSIGAAFLPWWVNWLTAAYPDLELRVVVTRSAQRFVSRHALTAFARQHVSLDQWPDEHDEPVPGSVHVEYATWPDAIAVYPATFHFLARLATGLADTPMMLALQCTSAVVGVAPAVPPGAVRSAAYGAHIAALARRPGITVAAPMNGRSAHTGDVGVGAAAPLPVLLRQMELLRRSGDQQANGRARPEEAGAWRR